jgi:hypothetical protein
MKFMLVGLSASLLALTAPIAAHADGASFKGGCSAEVTNDGTSGGVLGGQDVWNGDVRVVVVPNDLGQVTASCSIKVNGVDRGVALTASGTGIAVGAGRITFTAAVSDVVALCTTVTTPSTGSETVCADITQFDGDVMCSMLRTFAGTSVPPVEVKWDGDVYLFGFRVIDCPPLNN